MLQNVLSYEFDMSQNVVAIILVTGRIKIDANDA